MNVWSALPGRLDVVFSTWDCTFKDLRSARGIPDYVAGHVWAKAGAKLYLLPWEFRQQVDITNTIGGILAMRAWCEDQRLPLSGIYVEDKANGPAVIQLLRQSVPGMLPWPGDGEAERRLAAGSKESRAQAASRFVRAGNVLLPSPAIAPWIVSWLAEVEGYPLGAFDDRVDGLSMACAVAFLDADAHKAQGYWDALKGLGVGG